MRPSRPGRTWIAAAKPTAPSLRSPLCTAGWGTTVRSAEANNAVSGPARSYRGSAADLAGLGIIGAGAIGAGAARAGGLEGDGTDQQLRDVDYFEAVLGFAGSLLGRDRIAEHDQAVRAGGGDGVRVQLEGLVDPLGVDPLADPLFHPHPGAARAAAEPAVLAPVHLLGLHARHGLHDLPGRGEHLVMPAQEARVVIGELLLDRVDRLELAFRNEAGEQLGVVDDLVVPAQLRVLPGDGVEAVRARRHDLARRGLVED